MKSFLLGVLSIVIALFFLFIVGELVARAYFAYDEQSKSEKLFSSLTLDDELGWRPSSNYRFSGELRDASGELYPVELSTDSEGFRIYGDAKTDERKKVLFLGDSFTQAMQVSDDKTYYALLGEAMDIEIFAYGVDGYGSLQEYMVLDKYVDEIKPDAVIIQFCPNDIINNHPDLERRSSFNRMGLRRPYLVDGEVVYITAASFPRLRQFAASYSKLLYTVIRQIDRLTANRDTSIERIVRKEGMNNPLFRESLDVVDQVLAKVMARVPEGTEVFAFSSHWGRPYHPAFIEVAQRNGIRFINGNGRGLDIAEKKGLTTKAADRAHWNNRGHRIVADTLQRYLEKIW